MRKLKLKPAQLNILDMLAVCGEAAIDLGAELACARGLHRRKIPLVILRWDADEGQLHPQATWVARLTEAGAAAFEQHSNFNLKQHTDGNWMIDSVRIAKEAV